MTATASRTLATPRVTAPPAAHAPAAATGPTHHEAHASDTAEPAGCALCREATGVWVAPRLDRPRVPLADRLDAAATALGLVLLLVVPPLAWWAVGRWTGWGLPLHLGVAVVAGVLAALAPIFLATYLVGIRRGFREVDAEIDERWPQYARR